MQKLPVEQISKNLSSPSAKNISLFPRGKSVACLGASHPNEGRVAIVTNVAVRCGGRKARDRRARAMRTAKSCGPGAPMLASSSWEASFSGMTVANKPVTGESAL
jgi:hypothetical protein